MKLITSKEIFDSKKSRDTVICECFLCKKHFEALKKDVTRELVKKNGYINFCSKSCASKHSNSQRVLKDTTKNKISNSLIKFNDDILKIVYLYNCEKCNSIFESKKIRDERKKTCEKCRRKRIIINVDNIDSLYELSLKTVQKILKKAKVKCVMCSWDRTSLDIHHIDGRKIDDPHNHKNLVCLCPNCHRLAGEKKIDKKILREKSLFNTFINWKEFYNKLIIN